MSEELPFASRVVDTLIEEEMKRSYLKYSMSVIVSRALPDVRDGLKPVHRRILYGMQNIGVFSDRPYKKSANIIGEVMGKYHPHGDSAIYDTLVRMAQEFSMRYPLVDGQGNFGSVDGDPPAAMRYTEARMNRFAELMLEDLEKNTVNFAPNYDDSTTEPVALPSAMPNLLVNGTTGIAVGMATNMAPHNLREIVSACQAMIENPELPDSDLLRIVSGPDFPTGAIIKGRAGIQSAYLTGKGRVVVRARSEIEEVGGRHRIIVTEIPFQVNKANLLQKIAGLVREKVVEGISDLRDESDRNGMRIVIELKKDAYPDIVLNTLHKHTQLQDTFSIHNLALVNGRPQTLTLRQLIRHYLDHRHEVVVRRTQFDLDKAEARAHILEGLRIALDHIDEIIQLIKSSPDTASAQNALMERFGLSEKQSQAILEMRLQRLTGLEREKIENEYQELLKTIANLKDILGNQERRFGIINSELQAMVEKYGDERRTSIEEDADELTHLDLIADEPMVVTVSHSGYIKRVAPDTYRAQGRGGRGITATGLKDEDYVEHLFIAWAHSYILVFTNLGRCYWLRVFTIPEAARSSKGKALVNLVNLQPGETVSTFVPVKDFEDTRSLVLATRCGIINKMLLNSFSRPRQGGINAITLDDSDELVKVVLAEESDYIMLGTKLGQANQFPMTQFRQTGRGTRGVRGIQLANGDVVVGLLVLSEGVSVLTITEKGFGKRSDPSDYRITARGGKGVRNIRITDKNGAAVCMEAVRETDDIMVITREGIIIRLDVSSISVIGRSTQGVRVIRLKDADHVMAVALFDKDTEEIVQEALPEKESAESVQEASASDLDSEENGYDEEAEGDETGGEEPQS